MSWQWIDNDQDLNVLLEQAAQATVVAVDTEFRRRDTFWPEVALVQLCFDSEAYLIDPLKIDDTGPLAALLTDPKVVKVLHSASEDLEVFDRWLGVLPTPLFDTQKAAAMLNMGFGLSYRGLVELLLDLTIAKDETNSDWLLRPLTPAQCEYAALDVTHLMACWQLMAMKANELGRFSWILEEGAAMNPGGRGPLAKFKSAWKLAPQSLAMLLALLAWREDQARARDKPRSWILADKIISELARHPPQSIQQLAAAGVPAGLLRRNGEQLMTVLQNAASEAEHQPPKRLLPPAGAQQRKLAKRLVETLNAIADRLAMNAEILMPSRELELLAREAFGESIAVPESWQGWRAEAVIMPMRDAARRAAESEELSS